jgi:hypothetical protein
MGPSLAGEKSRDVSDEAPLEIMGNYEVIILQV